MTLTSRTVTLTGLLLLAHACYSAQEYTALTSTLSKSTLSGQHIGTSLPVDICIETVAATLVVCLGLVLGSQKLQPIQWHVWAGKIEREGSATGPEGERAEEQAFSGNPFAFLENRPSFIDIRKQRQEFADWAKIQAD